MRGSGDVAVITIKQVAIVTVEHTVPIAHFYAGQGPSLRPRKGL